MKRSIRLLVVVSAMFFVACNFIGSLSKEASTPTPRKHPATKTASPTNTPAPTGTSTPTSLPATDAPPTQPPAPIGYYYFVEIESESPPAGSVVILADILILGPTHTELARSPDIVENIRSALQVMLNDPRNAWNSTDLAITRITFKDGTAKVALQGKYFAPGDIVLISAREQMLFTVFAEPTVQTATITLNGKNIANLGISRSSQASPEDYAYTRAEIETFMAENAYWK